MEEERRGLDSERFVPSVRDASAGRRGREQRGEDSSKEEDSSESSSDLDASESSSEPSSDSSEQHGSFLSGLDEGG
ncbi:hypothetical protein Dimus_029584, partial [Dionaea muscipula]